MTSNNKNNTLQVLYGVDLHKMLIEKLTDNDYHYRYNSSWEVAFIIYNSPRRVLTSWTDGRNGPITLLPAESHRFNNQEGFEMNT